jgi:hypothetical protein
MYGGDEFWSRGQIIEPSFKSQFFLCSGQDKLHFTSLRSGKFGCILLQRAFSPNRLFIDSIRENTREVTADCMLKVTKLQASHAYIKINMYVTYILRIT